MDPRCCWLLLFEPLFRSIEAVAEHRSYSSLRPPPFHERVWTRQEPTSVDVRASLGGLEGPQVRSLSASLRFYL